MNHKNNTFGAEKYDFYFMEDSRSSESEDEICYNNPKRAQISTERSPPLILMFTSSRKVTNHACQTLSEDSDQSLEDWMIVDEKEQEGDSNIQLNLTYWSSSEDDCEQTEITKETEENWLVSDKDMNSNDKSPASRSFVPGRFSVCHICNKTGHIAKSCYRLKKSTTCIFCGNQGHTWKDCPTRPCTICGLPSHGLELCKVPPVWNQHCQRCGMTGHLFNTCPDTWRQYHRTISSDVPLKPKSVHHLLHRRDRARCYNCSKRGHYGHECTRRRMVSGTFPSLPYVCHYDTLKDILQHRNRLQKEAKEVINFGVPPHFDQEHSFKRAGQENEKLLVQRRIRTKQVANSQASRKRTWPERRKVRRQVKRLKREAQAVHKQTLLDGSCYSSDYICSAKPKRNSVHDHNQSKFSSNKKKRDETTGRKIKKSKGVKNWKKERVINRRDVHLCGK